MEWYELELDEKSTCKFPENLVPGYEQIISKPINERGLTSDHIGGIINHGKWGWIASDGSLLICALDNGNRVALHTFWRKSEESNHHGGQQNRRIICVEELFASIEDRVLLAVLIEVHHSTPDLAIYTPTCSQILRYIDLHSVGIYACNLKCFSLDFCARTVMRNFNGCLGIGTHTGEVYLMDMNATQVIASRSTNIHHPDEHLLRAGVEIQDCRSKQVVDRKSLAYIREQDDHLALRAPFKLELDITSLIPLETITGFAAGLEDGRILIFDLRSNSIVTTLNPPSQPDPVATVERLCCIVPPNDPKPCFYICAVYKQRDRLITSLHVLNYKRSETLESSTIQFTDFQRASMRFPFLLDESHCSVIDCSTVDKDNDKILTAISWHSHKDHKNKFALFDIDQWYTDAMPASYHHYRHGVDKAHYLCGYVISGLHTGLCLKLDASSVIHFISQQRHDEHFYPNALSFECSLLTISGCRRYIHVGLQRRFLSAMCSQRASLFLNPEPFLEELMRLRLMPQFCEHNLNATLSKDDMYELILSVALEHNRIGLLNNCVQICLDGSFFCNKLRSTKLTLSILTNWIVKRAGQIKKRCEELCHGIFEYRGYTLSDCDRKEFQILNAQLWRLQQLQLLIGKLGKSRFSSDLLEDLNFTEKTLSILYEYHRVVIWLIEQQILPEGLQDESPLGVIKREIQEWRPHQKKLYIDEFLHFSGFLPSLQKTLYPPESLQTLMHLLLLPNSQLSDKHELLLYLLLDWDDVESRRQNSKGLFQQYVLAFDLAEPLVRSVRSFWLLDRGQYTASVKELYRFPSMCNNYKDWQTQLLLDVLLQNDAVGQAMQVMDLPPGPISSKLQLRVLLASQNIPEAFHHARLYEDEQGRPLLEYFFEDCIRSGNFTVLASLCLWEHEEEMVCRLLRQCKTRQTDAVQLILLLKRSKYIQAASLLDEAAERSNNFGDRDRDETNTLLSAYRSTMAPVTQSIAGQYFRIRDQLQGDQLRNSAPEPFSCQLAKQNATGQLEGIFQSSALSAHWATRYVKEPRSLNSQNMPFLRNPAQTRNQLPLRPRLVQPTPHHHHQVKKQQRSFPCEESLPAMKRRRLLGDHPRSFHLEAEPQPDPEQPELQLQDQQQVQALLMPPAYLDLKKDSHSNSTLIVMRPQVILKRRPVPVPVPASGEDSLLSKRKSFRFMPPIPLERNEAEGESWLERSKEQLEAMDVEEQEEEEQQQEEEQEDEEEEEETDEIFVEIEQQPSSAMCSEEENDSQSQSQTDRELEVDSDSEYLSPLASANVSYDFRQEIDKLQQKQMEEQEEEQEQLEQEEEQEQLEQEEEQLQLQLEQKPVEHRMAPPTGPSQRPSLLQATKTTTAGSSGFGSYHSNMQVTNTCSLELEQFVPPICSSKMTSSCLITTTTTTSTSTCSSLDARKISDRTTICGDLEEPSVVLAATSHSVWPMVSTTPTPVVPQTLQMLDTTLGMSSYDMTTAAGEEEQLEEELDLRLEVTEEEEEEEEQLQQDQQQEEQLSSPVLEEQQQIESSPEVVSVEDDDEDDPPTTEEDDDVELELDASRSAMDYQRNPSPSYSISSELSDMSSSDLVSSHHHPARHHQPDAPVYSIVLESTNSITTSRSPTSHTPTSFLPSDTNVSQNSNSSPRHGHGHHGVGAGGVRVGGAGDGNQRGGLYPANSLETVDDLDTTKGSLDEDEDVDEDECVIALDGTEVRGYVARPEPLVACSSDELFSFKQQQEQEKNGSQVEQQQEQHQDQDQDQVEQLPQQSVSLAATVGNSDSDMAYTINLDSSEEGANLEDAVAPTADNLNKTEADPASSNDDSTVSTVAQQEQEQVHPHPPTVEADSSDVEIIKTETESESSTPRRNLRIRLRSNNSRDLVTPDTSPSLPDSLEKERTPARHQLRALRGSSVHSEQAPQTAPTKPRQLRGSSVPALSMSVPVSTPKRRKKLLPKPLEAIQENEDNNESMPRTRSRTRLNQVSTPTLTEEGLGATDRCVSEPPVDLSKSKMTRRRSSRLSGDSLEAATTPTTSSSSPIPTTGRVLRSRRPSQDPVSSASVSAAAHINEAHVPPKKRGRNKKE